MLKYFFVYLNLAFIVTCRVDVIEWLSLKDAVKTTSQFIILLDIFILERMKWHMSSIVYSCP